MAHPCPPGEKAMPTTVIGIVSSAAAVFINHFKMSKLEYLDLRYNQLDNSILSYMDGLSSLKSLYLDYNRLKGLIDLKEYSINLETLYLSGNNISKVVASGGPTNVSTLYLNDITSYGSSFQTLLQSLGALPNLKKLDLGNNDLRGRILSDGFLNLKNLELLDLSYNTLNSNSIFRTIGTMNSLKTLWLQGCSFNGQLPISQGLCDLNHLRELDISSNKLVDSCLRVWQI
ncbi:hypothetical protein DKX38_028165 [Salix brachista]|uniref:Leucine-rich repeat-containing N-terminal plant-type domain-containing protein n=1 Tax=Salix brachista TaxID=2182728 RepID=A0A5N5J4V7_9ROSI|nr:hypothetical protein DKX38_028165 [Salix brachista]